MLSQRQIRAMIQASPYAKFIEPSRGDVHVNVPLTNIMLTWFQDEMGFVATKVFPLVPTGKESDIYFEYDMGTLYADDMKRRASSTESAGSTHKLHKRQFLNERWALHEDIDDAMRANQDMPLNEDAAKTMILSQKAMIRRERLWAEAYLKDGVWSYSFDGAATRSTTINPKVDGSNNVIYWNAANSTPIEDVRFAKRTVGLTGFRPNVMVLGRDVCDVLVDHEDIIGRLDRGQTTGPAQANLDDLARLFELDEVLVMDGVYNTKNAGVTADNAYIGGKNALLVHRSPMPSKEVPSAGYTFSWQGFLGATEDGFRMKRFRMEHLTSDRIEIEGYFDQKLVSKDLGFFFDDIVQ